MRIKKIVKSLMRKFKTNNPFEIAECLGIKVMTEPLGNIKGFYQACPKNKVLHINKSLDDVDKRMVCAHELGHAMLHSKLNILFLEKNTFCVRNKYEREANIFAAELLVSDDLLKNYAEYSIENIAAMENLHVELISLKFT